MDVPVFWFPFFMETDPQTKKFSKFSFSWKQPVTWWFIFILLGQCSFFFIDMDIAWKFYNNESVVLMNVPSVFATFMLLEHIFFFMAIAMLRYFMFKYSHIRSAIFLIKKVHDILCAKKNLSLGYSQSVKRQVVIGIILAVVCVSYQFRQLDKLKNLK